MGDKCWKRNHFLFRAVDNFTAKLAPKFTLCTIKKVISPLVYQLIDSEERDIGKCHIKDLKPYLGPEDNE